MRQLIFLILISTGRAVAAPSASVAVTNNQAVFTISGAAGPCTLEVSLSNIYTPLIRDVDPTYYSGSNVDTIRADTITHLDGTRIVTVGHAINDRGLYAATLYYWRLSGCGGTAMGTFTTDNIPPGFTQQFPFLTNPANWGNRANSYSIADLLAKTPVPDPITGAKLTPISGLTDITWRYPGTFGGAGTARFAYYDGGSGWTNPAGVLSGPSSNARTSNGNAIDLYISAAQEQTLSGSYADPFRSNATVDFALKMFGSGTHVNICIFTNPADGCPGTVSVNMTGSSGYSQVTSSSADPDHPWPSQFPQAYFAGWASGTRIGILNKHTTGTMSAVAGLMTIDSGRVSHLSAVMPTVKAGQKIHVGPAGITSGSCVNNLCTVASVLGVNKVQLVEAINANTGTVYEILGWGVRITNANPGTAMDLGVEWKAAGVAQILNDTTNRATCPPGTGFASGGTPSRQLRVCSLPTLGNNGEWYLLSEDGVISKPLHPQNQPPDSYFTGLLGWDAKEIPHCDSGGRFAYGYCRAVPRDARSWYFSGANRGGTSSIWIVTYTGDGTEKRDWNYTRGVGGEGYTQCGTSAYPWACEDATTQSYDMMKWEILTGYSADILSLIHAYDPTYDESLYGGNFTLSAVTQHGLYFQNQYGGGQDLPMYLAILDSTTKRIVQLVNSAKGFSGAFPGGYSGVHNVSGFPQLDTEVMQVSFHSLGAQYERTVTAATSANPMVLTDVGHGFTVGSHPIITMMGGTAGWDAVRNRSAVATVIDADTISVPIDTSTLPAWNNPTYGPLGYAANVVDYPHNATATVLHGGPWVVTPDAILRCNDPGYTSGDCSSPSWNTDLHLDWPIGSGKTCNPADPAGQDPCYYFAERTSFDQPLAVPEPVTTCPAGNAYESYGARNDYCITLRVPHGGFCNIQPTAAEIAHSGWTCEWNSGYSHPWDAQPGQLMRVASTQGFYGEYYRLISVSSGTEAGGMDRWVLQRNASGDRCAHPVPPYPGGGDNPLCVNSPQQNQFGPTWSLTPAPGGLYGDQQGGYLVHGLASVTVQAIPTEFSHSDLGPAATAGTYIYGASEAFTNALPIDSLFPLPPSTLNSTSFPKFHGASPPVGAGVQSYFSLTPFGTYGTDVNFLADNGGGGTYDSGVGVMTGPRDLVSLGNDIYRMEVYGTLNKYFFPVAIAGANLLTDVSGGARSGSGPTSALSSTLYSYCIPLAPNECYFGSTAGATGTHGYPLAYVHVPTIADSSLFPNGLISQHWANAPVIISGWPGIGAVRQQDMTTADSTGSRTRQVSYMMDIPGSQRTYSESTTITAGATVAPTALTNGVLIHQWLINTPPYPAGATSVANDVIGKPITIPAGPAYAEVQFGYSRIMGPDTAPSAFRCNTRAEACNTSGSPYNYESETRTLTNCASGCVITVPFMAPNVAYYRVRRSIDGATWTNTTDGTTPSEIQPLVDSGLRLGACATLAYNSSSGTVAAAGGTGTINITADSSCNSVHTSNQSWLTITAASSGCSVVSGAGRCTGSGSITWTVAANSGVARAGVITSDSGAASFMLSQGGSSSQLKTSLSPRVSRTPGVRIRIQ